MKRAPYVLSDCQRHLGTLESSISRVDVRIRSFCIEIGPLNNRRTKGASCPTFQGTQREWKHAKTEVPRSTFSLCSTNALTPRNNTSAAFKPIEFAEHCRKLPNS